MYTKPRGLGYLGAILTSGAILKSGSQYTFTWSHGRFFEYNTEAWVKENLNYRLQNFGEVVSTNRPLFSDHWVIVIVPTMDVSVSDWVSAFDASWKDMGYGGASLVQVEGGAVSTAPGGVQQIIPEVGTIVGKTAFEILKPLLPYVLIAGVGYLLLIGVIPKMIAKKT